MANKKKILVVDDAQLNQEMVKAIFEENFELLEAYDGEQAIQVIEEHLHELAIVLLDFVMPKMDGLDVLQYMFERNYMHFLPVIMITGEATMQQEERALNYGVSDIIHKPFAVRAVMRRTMNIIDLFESKLDMERKLNERTRSLQLSEEKLRRSNDFLVRALSSVVEFRNLESSEHVKRVQMLTGLLLKYVVSLYPEYHIMSEDVEDIVRAAALHDIGKIATPDAILLKPGKLTPEEFEEMKKHTIYGCELLEKFKQEDNAFYRHCYNICRYHHERWDGRGYPDHLQGDHIPISAQVVALADVFDALISKRVYKDPYVAEEAFRMIENGECGQFSPKIMDCFRLAQPELLEIAEDLVMQAVG